MGWWLSFASDSTDAITDSDQIATTRGWHDFGTWAEGLGDAYPFLAALVEAGGLSEAEGIATLEEELAEALQGRPAR
jgi:hypothetical protein